MIPDTTLQFVHFFGHLAAALLTATVGYWIYVQTEMVAKEWLSAYLLGATIMSVAAGFRVLSAHELYQHTILILYSALGVVAPLAIVGFAIAYIGRNPWNDRLFHVFALTLIPILLSIFSSPIHDYHFGSIVIHETPFPHYETAGSLGRSIAMIYALLAFVVLIYYFLILYLKSRRRPSSAILAFALGFGFAFSVVIISEAGIVPVETYDYTPYGIGVQAVAISYAVFALGLRDIGPVARDELIEHGDPFFALDKDYRLIDYNTASEQLLANLNDTEVSPNERTNTYIGEPILSIFPQIAEEFTSEQADTHVTASVDGDQRHYSVNISELSDWIDVRGYSVVLRDITELVRSQHRIEQQNERLDQFASIVSHDLRNPLNTAQLRLSLIETEDKEHQRPIQMKCDFENYAEISLRNQSEIGTSAGEMTGSINKEWKL